MEASVSTCKKGYNLCEKNKTREGKLVLDEARER
jgi:hypothetical protein